MVNRRLKEINEIKFKALIKEMIIKTLIKENIEQEGGNAIKSATPIRGDIAPKIANKIISDITYALKIEAVPLGSTGKKGADQTSGDIDISIGMNWEDLPKLQEFIHNKYGNLEEYSSKGFKIYSIGFPYSDNEGEKTVQVDFMFSKNPTFSSFAYHSPDYIKKESQYKGAFRMILLKNILGKIPLDEKEFPIETYGPNDFDGKYDGQVKKWWKYSLDSNEGLQIVHRTNQGVRKPLSTSKRIPEDTILISDNVDEIIKIGLGDSATVKDCNSWESLVDFVFSGRYKYGTEEMIKRIFSNFFKDRSVLNNPETYTTMKTYVLNKMKEKNINPPEELVN